MNTHALRFDGMQSWKEGAHPIHGEIVNATWKISRAEGVALIRSAVGPALFARKDVLRVRGETAQGGALRRVIPHLQMPLELQIWDVLPALCLVLSVAKLLRPILRGLLLLRALHAPASM